MFQANIIRVSLATLTLMAAALANAQQPLPAEGDESQLLAVLKSDAELFDKAKACQRLAIIGTDQAVPVLAKLLADDRLSHYARFGLEANPNSAVDAAFRQALTQLQGKPLIGVINSIGVRRDAQAVDALITLTGNEDEGIAKAALAALGQIATAEAIEAIQSALGDQESLRVAAADACLAAADRLLREGQNAAAATVYSAVRAADLPAQINVASRFGQIRVGSGDLNDLMLGYLESEDNDLFRIGLELAHEIPGAETTGQLLKLLASLPAQRQVLLIYILGDRGDAEALPAMLAAAESDNAEIKTAAIDVLGSLGDQSVLPVLLDAAVSDDDALAGAARASLAQLPGPGVDAAIAQHLSASSGAEQLVLVDAVGRRGISSAVPTLLKLTSAGDENLQNAAIEALGMTVGLKELSPLVDQLIESGSQETVAATKQALRRACQRMPDRDAAADLLLERFAGASPAAKIELMDLLIYVGGEKALAGAAAAAKGSDQAAADAATQALGKWLTPDVAPVLLDLARSGNDNYSVRCLRGYIRVIRQFGLPNKQRLEMSKTAFGAASRDEERELVLDTLTRFPTPAALNMAVSHISDAALSEQACQAAVTIGEKIVDANPKPVATQIPKVVAAVSDQELANRAKVLIARAEKKLNP